MLLYESPRNALLRRSGGPLGARLLNPEAHSSMVHTLTDRFVAGVRLIDPTTRTRNIFDTKAAGLTLRVGTRTKVWYFVHRNGGVASRWLRLGRYPALGLAQARQLVHVERAKLDQPADRPVAALSPEALQQIEHVVTRIVRQELARHGQSTH
jgi:Arm DNA-binding domain